MRFEAHPYFDPPVAPQEFNPHWQFRVPGRSGHDAIIRLAPRSVLFAISFVLGDDIEVGFGVEDCRQIVAIFERVLRASADFSEQSGRTSDPFKYQFENLDGGADAAFIVCRIGDSVEITIHRSDEGDLALRISCEDARRLIGALKDALKVESAVPPN